MDIVNGIVDEKNGFRKGRACIDQVYTLTSIIRNRLQEKKPTFAAFIDFQNALEWVDRDLLLYKLLCNNINHKFYRAINAVYENKLSCQRLNGKLTPWLQSTTGVRQGDVLSPTFFSIYINDLAEGVKSLNLGVPFDSEQLNILLYADDIVILAETEENLQRQILWTTGVQSRE